MSFSPAEFAAKCSVDDPQRFAGRCEELRLFLEEANRSVNLTRITGVEDFSLKHVADSLTLFFACPEIAREPLSVADVGCGAGFPSLILALAYPQLQVTAIDSTGKKIAFVEKAARLLGLSRLRAVHGRAEELQKRPEFQSRFDLVTARAVAPSPKLFQETKDLPHGSGKWVFYKTPSQAEEEREELRKIRGVKWHFTESFRLPENAGERLFVIGEFDWPIPISKGADQNSFRKSHVAK